MRPNLISVGSWCRPAWQIRRRLGTETAYPFDWNITSYAALLHTLAPGYDPADELRLEDCTANQFGSVTDLRSGLVLQHDLPVAALGGQLGGLILGDDAAVRAHLDEVRVKMAFLFERFRTVCRAGPVVFVRWMRHGHPDGEWPAAFQGELPHHLHHALLRFCGHAEVRTLYVVTTVGEGEAAASACTLHRTSYGACADLVEARHHFREQDWTGDDAAWTLLFEGVAEDWLGLPVAAAPAT